MAWGFVLLRRQIERVSARQSSRRVVCEGSPEVREPRLPPPSTKVTSLHELTPSPHKTEGASTSAERGGGVAMDFPVDPVCRFDERVLTAGVGICVATMGFAMVETSASHRIQINNLGLR